MRARSGSVSSSPPATTKRGRRRWPVRRGLVGEPCDGAGHARDAVRIEGRDGRREVGIADRVEHPAPQQAGPLHEPLQRLVVARVLAAAEVHQRRDGRARGTRTSRSARQRNAFSRRSSSHVRLTTTRSPVEPLVERSSSRPAGDVAADAPATPAFWRSRLL